MDELTVFIKVKIPNLNDSSKLIPKIENINVITNNEITNLEIGIILQSIKNGSSESEYFHLFGDPGMKLPISLNSINNIEIDPDTLSALGNAYVTVNTPLFDNLGNGVLILKDSDKSVTREYNIASTTESISYILPGPTLFRGNFSFNDFPTTAQLRVPLDISYSNNPGKILIYIYNGIIIGKNNSVILLLTFSFINIING